ncbi:WD40-repeat-containing domain protein [Crucibulum laeve]|uniref:WD40-repeat-containing domain protein n=1 Tax=Crucibulum laeve TaxID=68775 RepID=A0A5C3LF87_9AGAR|nr:WD40-repeat-containing domain protein [Crucibulum laeve]
MPDSFFSTSKPRKRKRVDSTAGPGGKSKFAKKGKGDAGKKFARGVGGKPMKGTVKKRSKAADEELSDRTDEEEGIDDMDLRAEDIVEDSGEEDADETPAEKRLRLAKLYLESVKEGLAEGEFDAAEIDKELISARLKQDVMEHSGKVHLFIADSFDFTQPAPTLRTRGHRFSVTSVAASENAKYLFTAGKEGSIIKWDLVSGKKLATFHKVRPPKADKGKGKGKAVGDAEVHGHTDEVLALAMSGDGKLLASAGRDRKLCVWDVEKEEWVKSFGGHLGHKDIISVLAFRKGTNQLYTGSFDRTLKVYDLSPSVMGYVETLFGHQDHVLGLDALRGDTCVSVGARDKTARFWKIVEETQLVFRGGGRSRVREVLEGGLRGDDEDMEDGEEDGGELVTKAKKGKGKEKEKEKERKFIEGSLECVAMIDESTFVSGGDSGSICLWQTAKKKPVFTQAIAHGFHETVSATEGLIQRPRWVTALSSLRYSDIIASGSWDGCIRLWKIDSKLKSLAPIGTISAPGVVNSLQLLALPKGFIATSPWASSSPFQTQNPAPEDTEPIPTPAKLKSGLTVNPILLVAGMGQEHRLGRWLSVKEDGAANGTIVVALSPRTSM